MKKFILKTILIILPFVVLAIIFEVLLRIIPNDYDFKKQYLDKHSSQIETLILGSSHSYYGINPNFFTSKTFNASHISQSLNYDFEILKKYQATFISLKTVILPISYFTLFGKLEAGSEAWRVKNYVIYYGIDKSNTFIDHSEVLSNRLNVNIKRLFSNYVLNNPSITCTNLGWGIGYDSKNAHNLIETGKTAAKRHTIDNLDSDKNLAIFNENIMLLNSIIQWCKEKNIKILILTPPAYENYRDNLAFTQLKKTIETTTNICSKYDNCKYEKLLEDKNFEAIDFYDADHLSEIGAKKLSEYINKKIVEWK